MASSSAEIELRHGHESAGSWLARHGARRPRTLIILSAVLIGALAALVGRATTSWTGFAFGVGLLALLVILGTPLLFGPLTSRAELKRKEADLAEQARREAGPV
jgi:trimethylamine:corrinoid methyltransferase-like protein